MKKTFVFLLCLVLAVGVFTACGSETADAGSEEEAMNRYLTAMYTTDKNQRYTDFLAATEDEVDDALLEKMQANRIPTKYDELNQDDPVTVDSMILST